MLDRTTLLSLFSNLLIIDSTGRAVHETNNALFVSCTALPVLSIINKLEKRLNKVVLSSNQTLIWDSLNEINYKEKIEGFGKLFNS